MRATRAEIDLSAVQYNIKQIARKVGRTRVLGVMKANAYGHGIVQTSKAVLEAGASYIGVALAEEGIELRHHTSTPILVFSPPFEESLESYVRFDLDATIASIEAAHALNSVARTAGKKAKVQIKIDTGMGRIGFFPEVALDAIRAIANLDSLSIVGVYSHFATSDESNKEFARRQLSTFKNVAAAVRELGIDCLFHVANSGAVLDMPDSYFDMVRPGIMTYGYYPSAETTESVNIKPSLSLKSNVVQVKNFKSGMSISYGRKYFTRGASRVAVVPIGYGDGFTRLLTGKAAVLIRGREYPVAGTITMDHLMVDLGNDFEVQPGEEVTLIGKSGDHAITAWDIASKLGTIPYEVLCMINNRVPRLYNSQTISD
jgi:alanine racemase